MQCPDNRCKGKPCMAAICNLGCSCDIVTYRLKWPRGRIAHAHVLHRLYLYTLSLLSLRLSSAIKKLSWTMSLYISTNCYYVLFSQQHLGKKYRILEMVGIPTICRYTDHGGSPEGVRLSPWSNKHYHSWLVLL